MLSINFQNRNGNGKPFIMLLLAIIKYLVMIVLYDYIAERYKNIFGLKFRKDLTNDE
jgi:hypothetical protein